MQDPAASHPTFESLHQPAMSDPSSPIETSAYRALAAGYDLVMEHVDYEDWAEFVQGLLERWGDGVETILELGCGTGSLALALQPLGDYRYAGTDRIEEMLDVAREKAAFEGAEIQFEQADFTDFAVDIQVDAVLLLFDGINYLLEPEPISRMLACAFAALRPGGLFVFDLSTPANSINNADYFDDEGEEDAFSYRRRSSYDAAKRLHRTTFDLVIEGESYREEHIQRAWEIDEIRPLVAAAGFEILALLDGFERRPATAATERVHWVVRRPVGTTDGLEGAA